MGPGQDPYGALRAPMGPMGPGQGPYWALSAHMGPKCPAYAFVTKGVKLKDGELTGTSNEAEFRYASFSFLCFLRKTVFRRVDVS